MSDKILVEYQDNLNVLIQHHKEYQAETMKSAATEEVAMGKIKKSVDGAANSTKSLKTQLRELKEQIAQTAPGTKEFDRLTQAAGKLKDQINDTNESINILATGSKFEQINNAFGSIVTNVRNLDFARASEQAKVLLTIVRSLTFAEVIAGVKAFGQTIVDLGKALLTNPFTLMAAAIAALVYVIYDAVGAFSDFGKASKTLNESLKESEDRIQKLGEKQAEYLIKLAQAQGKLTKAQADAKLNELKNFQERTGLVKKFSDDVKKLADELGLSLADTKGGKFGEQYTGDYKDLLNRKKFNDEFVKLQQRLRQELSLQTKTYITEQSALTQEALNEIQKKEKDNAEKLKELKRQAAEDLENQNTVLRDLRTGNIASDYDREKQMLKDKLADDIKQYRENGAIIAELRIKALNDSNKLDEAQRAKDQAIDVEKVKAAQERINAIQKEEDDFEEATRKRNQRILEDGLAKMDAEIEARKRLEQNLISAITSGLESIGQISRNITERQLSEVEQRKEYELSSLEDEYGKKLISKEEYEKKRTEIEAQARKEESELKRKQFETDKQIALIQATISTAQAVVKALTVAPPAGIALAAIVGALGAAQIAAILSQPTPKFAKGGKVTGRLHSAGGTLIEAERDEWIIKRDQSIKNDRMLRAINDGEAESFIRVNYIVPALKEQQRKFDQEFNSLFGKSGDSFKDENLLDSLKASRRAERDNTLAIIKAVQSIGGRSRHKW
jgi:hypothetical protein